MKAKRDILKTYFETGDYPTEAQFAKLIDSYAHLNEFNFGLDVKPSGDYKRNYYHFYRATNVRDSGAGHKIVEATVGSTPPTYGGYNHILSRNVLYKTLQIALIGEIDIAKHQPKVIVERYKQRKKYPSGYIRPAGFYKENTWDAQLWNRKSEYEVSSNTMNLDLKPVHYFRPSIGSNNYKEFQPSGSIFRRDSFKFSKHGKPFVPIRLKLQINIDGILYHSKPVDLRIILGTSGEFDAINFMLF
ncbi:MAG: hypothetical protein HRT68_06115 [Flavobacteriaceae bacterium]|nr:hypothetical protein [Flavobacteriaceae bacterium]